MIAFIGDSFCSCYDHSQWAAQGQHRWQLGVSTPAWPSLVAQRLNLAPHYHGYAGKSWWYSRHQFLKNCQELLNQNLFSVVVICHTDTRRFNSTDELILNRMPYGPDSEEQRMLIRALDLYYGYLYEESYARWCQQNWLLEIQKMFANVPRVIQFTNFEVDLFNADNALGMCYRDPLMRLRLGRYQGTKQQIYDQAGSETMHQFPNHLTPENNLVMADLVVDAVNNYSPGIYDIDLAKFHGINDNIKNWPGSGHWQTP